MRKRAAIVQHILSHQLSALWAALAALTSLRASLYSLLIANSSLAVARTSRTRLHSLCYHRSLPPRPCQKTK